MTSQGSESAGEASPSMLSARELMRVTYGAQMSGVGLLVGGATGIMQSANEDYRAVSARPEQPRDRTKLNARAARRGLLLGGKYAGFVAGMVGCEIAIGRYRGSDDVWNLVGAGAMTGGAFCARGGAAAGIAGATMGAALSYLVGTGLAGLESLSASLEKAKKGEEEGSMLAQGEASVKFDEEEAMAMRLQAGEEEEEEAGSSIDKRIEHMEATLQNWPKSFQK